MFCLIQMSTHYSSLTASLRSEQLEFRNTSMHKQGSGVGRSAAFILNPVSLNTHQLLIIRNCVLNLFALKKKNLICGSQLFHMENTLRKILIPSYTPQGRISQGFLCQFSMLGYSSESIRYQLLFKLTFSLTIYQQKIEIKVEKYIFFLSCFSYSYPFILQLQILCIFFFFFFGFKMETIRCSLFFQYLPRSGGKSFPFHFASYQPKPIISHSKSPGGL